MNNILNLSKSISKSPIKKFTEVNKIVKKNYHLKQKMDISTNQ
jgi:hypothetical protein